MRIFIIYQISILTCIAAVQYDWVQSVLSSDSNTTTTPTVISSEPFEEYQCNRTMACGCGYSDVVVHPGRIISGEDVTDDSWSMIVSLRFNESDEHTCTGTILSGSFILTAAYCIEQFSSNDSVDVTIHAGITYRSDPNGYQRKVNKIFIHPNYTRSPQFLNDIAVLQINDSLKLQNNPILARACVRRDDTSLPIQQQRPQNGTRLAIVGWNITEHLKQVQVTTVDNQDRICQDAIADVERQFCAGSDDDDKKSPCLSDLGGPILYWTGQYWEQVGLIGSTSDCGRAGFPGVYTRLSYYWEWMETILNEQREYLEPQDPPPFPTTTTTRFTKPPRTTTNQTATSAFTEDSYSTTTTTTTTTTDPPKKEVYECNRRLDECGCSLSNVVSTQRRQQFSTKNEAGEDAYSYSWSMLVSLRVNGTKHICTGTILSDSFILTSAQCVSKQSNNNDTIIVVAGVHSLSQYATSSHVVDQIHIHENYTMNNPYVHDIAILHLQQSLELKTQPLFSKICLSKIEISDSTKASELISVGWKRSNLAKNESNIVQQVLVKPITSINHSCFNTTYNDNYQFCAGLIRNNTDGCSESFGEPIFVYRDKYWEQVGVLSKTHHCLRTGHSGIFTKLSAYIDWMQGVLKNIQVPIRQPEPQPEVTDTGSKPKASIILFTFFFFSVLKYSTQI